jgi:Protein of unknown function (Hypoth_ymh)
MRPHRVQWPRLRFSCRARVQLRGVARGRPLTPAQMPRSDRARAQRPRTHHDRCSRRRWLSARRSAHLDAGEAIVGPVGPGLSASELHPTVWDAARSLYDGKHYRAAVQAAATAVEMQLKAKLDRYDLSGDPLVTEAFSIAPPQPGKPRLRFTGVGPPAGSLWRDAHVGAMNFGKGCMMGIRNVVSHDTSEPQPEIALEQLAALSILARWIDAASLQTAQAPTQGRWTARRLGTSWPPHVLVHRVEVVRCAARRSSGGPADGSPRPPRTCARRSCQPGRVRHALGKKSSGSCSRHAASRRKGQCGRAR